MPEKATDLAKATLKLYVGNVTSPGTIDVYEVAGTWNEKSVTANAAPAVGILVNAGVQIDANKKGQYLTIDISGAVSDWLSGAPNNGLLLVAGPGVNVTFDSKENSQMSHEPELLLTWNRSAGAQGPESPQGPQGEKGIPGDPERKDQRATRVIRVTLEPRVNKELRDCKVQKATLEILDRRGQGW
jgi:hypothetical protein